MKPTLGKWRRLQQAADPQGTFTVLAIDHRGPLRRRLAQESGAAETQVEEALRNLKQDIVRHLAPHSSAVLLDPEVGLAACVESAALPGATGLLVALDTGSTGDPAVLRTGLVPDWSVERIARAGASGVKLLVYYHPEVPQAVDVERLVREIARDCARAEVPLYLEPLSYDPADAGTPLPSHARREVVVETARRLVPLGVDVLKAEFPVNPAEQPDEGVWREACQELSEACPVPWVLLSAGVPAEVFLRQTEIACRSGASGVIAGRALWNDAVTTDAARRRTFLQTTAVRRLDEVADLCRRTALPFWHCRAWREPR